jgi:Ser/Thr protein kinase RdoA (MazF antagonist)
MEQFMTALQIELAKRYGAKIEEQNRLGNSANLIYEISLRGKPTILRLSKHSEHKELHARFELAWMDELAKSIPKIAGPIPSLRGKLYEIVSADNEQWIISVFHKAPGRLVDPENLAEWNAVLFSSLGELMGRLHSHTRPYVENIGINEQFDWRHSFLFWPENNTWVDPDIQPVWEETLAAMELLPTSPEDYGIVHADIHHLNFHVEDGNIVLFDFDDCEYSWYAYDIASTLFFVASAADYRGVESGKRILERFTAPFLRGYQKHAVLPAHWYEMFPLFLRYRRLAQYKYFSNLFHGKENPHMEYLTWAKEDILSGGCSLAIDFTSIKQAIEETKLDKGIYNNPVIWRGFPPSDFPFNRYVITCGTDNRYNAIHHLPLVL